MNLDLWRWVSAFPLYLSNCAVPFVVVFPVLPFYCLDLSGCFNWTIAHSSSLSFAIFSLNLCDSALFAWVLRSSSASSSK